MMLKQLIILLLIILISSSCSILNKKEIGTKITISGYNYRYLPYFVSFNPSLLHYRIDTQKVNVDDYYGGFRINLKDSNKSYFSVYDSLTDTKFEMLFRTKSPPITMYINNIRTGGTCKQDQLLNCLISARWINFDVDTKFKIKHFRLSYYVNSLLKSGESNSYKLSDEQKEIVSRIDENTIVVFDEILIEIDKKPVSVDPFFIFCEP